MRADQHPKNKQKHNIRDAFANQPRYNWGYQRHKRNPENRDILGGTLNTGAFGGGTRSHQHLRSTRDAVRSSTGGEHTDRAKQPSNAEQHRHETSQEIGQGAISQP